MDVQRELNVHTQQYESQQKRAIHLKKEAVSRSSWRDSLLPCVDLYSSIDPLCCRIIATCRFIGRKSSKYLVISQDGIRLEPFSWRGVTWRALVSWLWTH